MSKIKLNIIIILIVSFGIKSYSQEISFVDSLENSLVNSTNANDSARTLKRIIWGLSKSKKTVSLEYGRLILEKCKRVTDTSLLLDAYDAAAFTFRINSNNDSAQILYYDILSMADPKKNTSRIAWSYYNLANIAIVSNNYDDAKDFSKKSYYFFNEANNRRMSFNSYWMLIEANQTQYVDTLINLITDYVEKTDDENDKLFYYLDLTNLYNKQENRSSAMHYVQLAMELADKNQNIKGIVKVYSQIANYFRDYQENYEIALVYYEKVLEIKLENNQWGLGDLYNQMGNIYLLMEKDSIAKSYFGKAIDYGKDVKHRHTIASAYMNMGDMYYQQDRNDDALNYYLKCYETGCDLCPEIRFHEALINIGNVYSLSDIDSSAIKFYDKSLSLAVSASDLKAQTLSYQSYGGLYVKQNKLDFAIDNYLKAYELAKNADYLEGQQYNSNQLSILYSNKNNYKEAIDYLKISNLLSDSIKKIGQAENLAKLETYFDFENLQIQRELEKTKSDEEIARQKLLRNFFVLGFVLVILSGFFIYRLYRRKRKDNIKLHEQKIAIETMAKKLHDADQAKLQFFTNVSHELRTPLTLILGMTEKLKEKLDNKNYVSTIRKNSLKLLQLINHLLDLRKLDSAKMKLSVKENDLVGFLKGVISLFKDLAAKKNISVDFQYSSEALTGFYDSDKLEKVFSNLLSNAVKYTNEDGWINVILNEDKGNVIISVNDNGIGITESELKNVFNRFYRISDCNNTGSGIGLALVKELVELHKGKIEVSSKKNEGSKFIVTIPIARHFYIENEIDNNSNEPITWNYSDFVDIAENDEEERPENKIKTDQKSILIVEDNCDLRNFIAGIFKEEYEIIMAVDGEEGCNLAKKFIPDVIISDIIMPKLSGIKLVENIKSEATTSHIPIILLTAKDDLATRLSGFAKGADDYINKPFDSIILKSRVENLLRLRKHLVEKFSKQFHLQPREISIEDNDQKFLQKTIKIIESNISNPNLNIDFMALELGVSRTQLYRKLKALTDYSANQFIRIIRLKRAAQILKQGQNNIAEVMDATGFSNYSYFNNCFKEYFGDSPKEYALLSVKGSLN